MSRRTNASDFDGRLPRRGRPGSAVVTVLAGEPEQLDRLRAAVVLHQPMLDQIVIRFIESDATVDQYTIQGDAFSRAIQEDSEVPVPLENALGNMKVIDAVFRAGESGKWERI